MIKEDNLEFSFLVSNQPLLIYIIMPKQKVSFFPKEDLAASFQAAVLDILMAKTKRLWENILSRPWWLRVVLQLIKAYVNV